MKLRGTLNLVIVLVVLCLLYWLVVRSEQETERTRIEASRLFPCAAADIDRISIRQEDAPEVLAERGADGLWAITEPHAIEADQIMWDRMADIVASLSQARSIEEDPQDLALYELDKPRLSVAAAAGSDAALQAAFGKMDPTQSCRYVQVNRGPVGLVDDRSFRELDRPLSRLRERHLFGRLTAPPSRIEIAMRAVPGEAAAEADSPAPWLPVVLSLDNEGQWHVEEPVKAPADEEHVKALLDDLLTLLGDGYIDAPEDLGEYGLASPNMRIGLQCGKDQEPRVLQLGKMDKEEGVVYAKRADSQSVFRVDGTLLSHVVEGPGVFREQRLLTWRKGVLASIHYVDEECAIDLENVPESGWRVVAPSPGPADTDAVVVFVHAVSSLALRAFVGEPRPEYGLGNPAVAITLRFQDGHVSSIQVGGPASEEGLRYVRQDTGAVGLLTDDEVALLQCTPFDFQPKALLRFSVADARRVCLTLDGEDYVFALSEDAWVVEAPAGKRWADQIDAENLLAAISAVDALSLEMETPPDDLAALGLAPPILSVEVQVEGTETSGLLGPLRIGRPTEDDSRKRFASAAGRSEILAVKQSVMDDVRQALKGVVDAQ